MNPEENYLINRGNSEYPSWEPAHWERCAEIAGFHVMCLDMDGMKVTKHDSAIRGVKAGISALEAEMQKLLTYPELTEDAKKLILAAIESQRTGKLEWSV